MPCKMSWNWQNATSTNLIHMALYMNKQRRSLTFVHWCMRKQFLPTLFVGKRGSSMWIGSMLQQQTSSLIIPIFKKIHLVEDRDNAYRIPKEDASLTYILFLYLYIIHFPVLKYAYGEDQTHSWSSETWNELRMVDKSYKTPCNHNAMQKAVSIRT